jgi:hypothetical protein
VRFRARKGANVCEQASESWKEDIEISGAGGGVWNAWWRRIWRVSFVLEVDLEGELVVGTWRYWACERGLGEYVE